MEVSQPGKVTEKITMLGRFESCVYLVDDGHESILLGGGMAHIIPDMIDQLEAFSVDERRISSICILHAHFDHCGAVPFLKRRWPWAKVIASTRAAELLAKPQIAQSIAEMNRQSLEHLGFGEAARILDIPLDGIEIEATMSDGDMLNCGSIQLEVLEVPGHSSCSIALYMPDEKALFASDAVGMRLRGDYHPTPNSNYNQYQQSLERLSRYDIDTLLLEHYGAYSGEDAHAFIPGAIKAARDTRRLIEETYARTRDVDQCTREISDIFLKRSGDSFLPDEVRAIVAGQMVRFIAKTMEE